MALDANHLGNEAMLFRALSDQGVLAVWVVDAAGELRMVSPALEDLIGISAPGTSASAFPKLFHLYDAAGTRRLLPEEVPLTRAASGEIVRDVVISTRPPGRPVRYLRCNAVPLTGPRGSSVGAIASITDVTAEYTAVSRQELVRRLLVDTVNHELRTPLTIVLANAELLVDVAPDLPADLRAPLSAIVRASGRLRDLVQQVSHLVDLERADHALRANTNVCHLLTAVAGRCRHASDRREIAVEVACPEDLEWQLDAPLVRKAVTALVYNAVTHAPPASEVTISANLDQDVLRVRVTDEGIGIPAHDLERLTKPFERGWTPLAGRQTAGLGLPIAQAVANCHQGALSFTHHRPQGFTVCMMLP